MYMLTCLLQNKIIIEIVEAEAGVDEQLLLELICYIFLFEKFWILDIGLEPLTF